jgi:hypothetical protein
MKTDLAEVARIIASAKRLAKQYRRATGRPLGITGDVAARRAPKHAMFDIDLAALIHERGDGSLVVDMEPIPCPRCGSTRTETRVTAPAKPGRA